MSAWPQNPWVSLDLLLSCTLIYFIVKILDINGKLRRGEEEKLLSPGQTMKENRGIAAPPSHTAAINVDTI